MSRRCELEQERDEEKRKRPTKRRKGGREEEARQAGHTAVNNKYSAVQYSPAAY